MTGLTKQDRAEYLRTLSTTSPDTPTLPASGRRAGNRPDPVALRRATGIRYPDLCRSFGQGWLAAVWRYAVDRGLQPEQHVAALIEARAVTGGLAKTRSVR